MKVFTVDSGSKGYLMTHGTFGPPQPFTTRRPLMFEREQIVVDPLHPGVCVNTIGYEMAKSGHYGFIDDAENPDRPRHILFVPFNLVNVI